MTKQRTLTFEQRLEVHKLLETNTEIVNNKVKFINEYSDKKIAAEALADYPGNGLVCVQQHRRDQFGELYYAPKTEPVRKRIDAKKLDEWFEPIHSRLLELKEDIDFLAHALGEERNLPSVKRK